MFPALVSFLVSMTGAWTLPVPTVPTELIIGQHKNKAAAVLKINTNCKKPVFVLLRGTVKKEKCGTLIDLSSNEMKLSKSCKMSVTILGCGKVVGNRFINKSVIATGIFCKGKPPKIEVDSLSKPWIRKSTKKRPSSKGKTISI
jgi:hypothetical protein